MTAHERQFPRPNTDFTVSGQKLRGAAIGYCALLTVFWFVARFFGLKALDEYPVSTFLSFALLFAPYWFFGFGAAEMLRARLKTPALTVAVSAVLALPYFVLEAPRGNVQAPMAAVLIAIPVLVAAVLKNWPRAGNWADFLVLGAVGLLIDLGLLTAAWPLHAAGVSVWPAGLSGFPKLMMANVALYGYLVVKPIESMGYDLRPRLADLKYGLREFFFCAPMVLSLGFLLGFLHWHGGTPRLWTAPAAWTFTFFMIALPEELFFRGLVQNLLERHVSQRRALCLASVLFGLSHFNKGATFNWNYVLLATIAGLFYGRAWHAQRRLFASSITHASVDTVWSIWFR